MRDLEQALEELSPEKRKLLLKLIREKQSDTKRTKLLPRPAGAATPLSSAQLRLWFLDKLLGRTAAYNVPIVVPNVLPIAQNELEVALGRLVDRHQVLRSTFPEVDGEPILSIAETMTIPTRVVDLTSLPDREARRCAQSELNLEALKEFDLSEGPLLRSLFLRMTKSNVLLIVMHHIVCDGVSIDIVLRELRHGLRAGDGISAEDLPPLPIQYADYAWWQSQWMDSSLKRDHSEYWRRQLAELPILELPTRRARPPVQTFHGDRIRIKCRPVLGSLLRSFAQQEKSTPFIVALAAFSVLLSRYSGLEDIPVGIPVEGRTRPEVQHLIGLFVNTLVLRNKLADDPTFRTFVAQVKETTHNALIHQELPFEELVRELQPNRDPSRNPLFQVFFQLQIIAEHSNVERTTVNQILSPQMRTSKFDLTLELFLRGNELEGRWEYNSDLFDSAFVVAIARHFEVVLSSALSCPDRRVSELELMSEADIKHSICRSSDPVLAAFTGRGSILDLFDRQVDMSPDAIAIVHGDNAETYQSLDESSDRIAQFLRECGAGAGSIVGIAVDRSATLVSALLGILKTGAAYMPVDPSGPVERLKSIITDCQPILVLTNSHHLRELEGLAVKCCSIEDVLFQKKSAFPRLLKRHQISGEHPAYIIYTSGSTGLPKGVVVSHRSLFNCLNSIAVTPGITKGDKLLAVTTLTFDIAGLELFLPLISGTTVIMADRVQSIDGQALLRLMKSADPTIMQATPATWRLLQAAGWEGSQKLTVLCGGESLPWDLAEWMLPRTAALWNMYGPTETTIWSCAHRVSIADEMPILGGPLANTEICILDKRMRRVPEGVAGEIYIGGLGVAIGYLNRPELTEERFVECRVEQAEWTRFFKTGDMGRFVAPGKIEFLGRKDHQVKIRGFRIELAEIESVIRRYPGIAEAVVLKTSGGDLEDRLVAYGVVDSYSKVNVAELRIFIKRFLPDYMCPSSVLLLDRLPLNRAGKVDRLALSRNRPPNSNTSDCWNNKIEGKIAAIWSQIVGGTVASASDNFFDIGGTSLGLLKVARALNHEFKIEIPILDLLRNPTIESLATHIDATVRR